MGDSCGPQRAYSGQMHKNLRRLRLKQLDAMLNRFRELSAVTGVPRRGWIRELRAALGMTAEQLAARMQISQSTLTALEQSEAEERITLKSLQKAARALDCELVYALVPVVPLEDMLRSRLHHVAKERLERTAHTMTLEGQTVSRDESTRQLSELITELMEKPPRNLWHPRGV